MNRWAVLALLAAGILSGPLPASGAAAAGAVEAAHAPACASALSPAEEQAMLAEARRRVDQRRFADALSSYDCLLALRPDDPDRLIEVARVLGFADRNAESARMYRRMLAVAPQRRADVRRSLGWQTLWSGDAAAAEALFVESLPLDADPADAWQGIAEARQQREKLPGALDAYGEVLRIEPDNVNIARRRAQLLVWSGRYQEGIDAFEALLAQHPDDRLTRIGLARALDDAGRHRQAVLRFREAGAATLEDDERFAYARALRWSGFDELADRELADIDDADAQWLRRYRTSRELSPRAFASFDASTDRDRLAARTVAAGGSWYLPRMRVVGASVRRTRFDDPHGRVHAQRVQADASMRIGEPESDRGVFWPSASIAANDYRLQDKSAGSARSDWHPLTGVLRLRWLPVDPVRLDFELGRETVETPKAIGEHVTIDVASAGIDWRPLPHWSWAASVARLRFDDGNGRNRIQLRAQRRFLSVPRVWLGVEAQAFRSSDPIGPTVHWRGYWNPEKYREIRAFVSWSHDWQGWQFEARGGLGTARETDGWGNHSRGRPNLWELAAARDLSPDLQLRGVIGGTGSGMGVSGGGSGYWRRYAGISLTGWF